MYLLASISALCLGFGTYVATRPSAFRIERSKKVKATPEAVFALISNFRAWEAWSPWDKLDASMVKHYSGPTSGEGAKYHWIGNKNVGEGKMTIVAAATPSKIVIDLQFIKPFEARNTTTFTIEAQGDETIVTWAMEGERNFFFKAFNIVMNMDKMVGADFEKGLAALEEVLAKSASEPLRMAA